MMRSIGIAAAPYASNSPRICASSVWSPGLGARLRNASLMWGVQVVEAHFDTHPTAARGCHGDEVTTGEHRASSQEPALPGCMDRPPVVLDYDREPVIEPAGAD